MKNADMPAMPCEVMPSRAAIAQAKGCGFDAPTVMTYQGLTKREMMAMHAPEVPDWFDSKWRDDNKSNGMFFIPLHDGCSGLVAITETGSAAMYFAWRTHYADSLLAELERTCHKT